MRRWRSSRTSPTNRWSRLNTRRDVVGEVETVDLARHLRDVVGRLDLEPLHLGDLTVDATGGIEHVRGLDRTFTGTDVVDEERFVADSRTVGIEEVHIDDIARLFAAVVGDVEHDVLGIDQLARTDVVDFVIGARRVTGRLSDRDRSSNSSVDPSWTPPSEPASIATTTTAGEQDERQEHTRDHRAPTATPTASSAAAVYPAVRMESPRVRRATPPGGGG